jgi:O-antigen ligase
MLISDRRSAALPPVVVAAGAVGAAVAGLVIARQPALALAAAIGGLVLWYLLPRLTLVTAILAGCFFYDDLFTEHFGFWNPGKLIGVVAIASFALDWLIGRRPIVWSKQVVVLIALTGSLAISYSFALDRGAAVDVIIRYVMFFALFFIALQAINTRADIDWIIDVTVAAATLAALMGLYNFFFHGDPRVNGPLKDPGDFGFLLGSTVPLAVYRAATSTGRARVMRILAIVALVGAIIGTFARADALGLSIAGVWVIATGRVRVRWAAIAVASLALIALTAYQVRPDLIENSLHQKEHIAQQNINSRFGLWGVAYHEWSSAPVFGVGPGNYEIRFDQFRSPFELRVQTTHNAYLNVLAELGLFGLVLFLAYLVLSWLELQKRSRGDRREDWMRTAIAAGFLVAIVGANFMTEQFYPPFWFLAALGTAAARVSTSDDRAA